MQRERERFQFVCSLIFLQGHQRQIRRSGDQWRIYFFERKIARLGSKMYHMSVNLAISRRKKIFGVQKASGAAKGYIRGRQKIVSTFFNFFLKRHLSFCGGAKKSAGGVKWSRYATAGDFVLEQTICILRHFRKSISGCQSGIGNS